MGTQRWPKASGPISQLAQKISFGRWCVTVQPGELTLTKYCEIHGSTPWQVKIQIQQSCETGSKLSKQGQNQKRRALEKLSPAKEFCVNWQRRTATPSNGRCSP